MNIISLILYTIGGLILCGVILGYFLRWKMLLVVTLILPNVVMFITSPVLREMNFSFDDPLLGGAFYASLLFAFSAWSTRLVCSLFARFARKGKLV